MEPSFLRVYERHENVSLNLTKIYVQTDLMDLCYLNYAEGDLQK